jgi:hypothetical protein
VTCLEGFDELAKGLATSRLSRGHVLKGLAAGVVATALGPLQAFARDEAVERN